jgi:hypothetical protein
LRGDVIGLRVRQEVKNAWDNLSEHDKDKIRGFMEELILLHSAGFNMDLRRQEFDGLRAEVCPSLLKAVEYFSRSLCIFKCYDENVRNYFSYLQYNVQKLCKSHPVRVSGNAGGVADTSSFNA